MFRRHNEYNVSKSNIRYPCTRSMTARKLLNFASMCEASRLEPNSAQTRARLKSTAQHF